MGDNVAQDYGLSRKTVFALQEMLEEEWLEARLDSVKQL
jgi:hypothetical protein